MDKYIQSYPNSKWCENYHKHTHYHVDMKWLTIMVGIVEFGLLIFLLNRAW